MLPDLSRMCIGTITNLAPPPECAICSEGIYGCEHTQERQKSKRPRGGTLNDNDRWYECSPDDWTAPRPVVVLDNCGHYFHCKCMTKWIRQSATDGQPTSCPTCKTELDQWEIDELNDTMVIENGRSKFFDLNGRIVEVERPDGNVVFYEGRRGQERIVRQELPDGTTYYYEEERVVRKHDNGNTIYYEGPLGQERAVRQELPDGITYYYEGPKGQERFVRKRVVRQGLPDVTYYFEGSKGQERIVRVEFVSGEKQYYDGPKGQERLVRAELVSGEKQYFEGPKGQSRIVRKELPDGSVVFFEGIKGQERAVREFRTINASQRALLKEWRTVLLEQPTVWEFVGWIGEYGARFRHITGIHVEIRNVGSGKHTLPQRLKMARKNAQDASRGKSRQTAPYRDLDRPQDPS